MTTKRITTVRDILYCENHCSKKAHLKILDLWSGTRIQKMEKSRSISALRVEELTLMNRLFGSASTCHSIDNPEIQQAILRLMPFDLYKNFRRATFNRPMAVSIEDWVWTEKQRDFMDELDIELTCLENVIVSFLVYLIGGFTIPTDDKKYDMQDWVKVDVHSLFSRPRELFLLTNMSPSVLSRYVYWKCTSILMGLMRHFSRKVEQSDIDKLHRRLRKEGIE